MALDKYAIDLLYDQHVDGKIRDGIYYKLIFTSSATTSGDVKYLQINGASGVEGHLDAFRTHVSDGFVDIKFIACSTSSTHTTGSASVSSYNKNRTSTNTASLTFFSDPTDVDSTASDNIVLDRFQAGGTGGSATVPAAEGELGQEDKWLIGNSTYIIEITCLTTALSFYLNGSLLFYEKISTSIT